MVPKFWLDSPDEIVKLVAANYKPEPEIHFTSTAMLIDANIGSLSKYYVHTLKDRK
jgi:hypothetical protein